MRLVFGFGINDADYKVSYQENGKQLLCPFYKAWTRILERAYSTKSLVKYPSYKDCTVNSEWMYFMTFKRWMEQQDWEGKELDKDLLIKGNKEYGPDTCLFLPKKVNMFIVCRDALERGLPSGVSYHNKTKKFRARANDIDGVCRHIGCYNTVDEASNAYMDYKMDIAVYLAGLQEDPKIKSALLSYYSR